jgi:hypothetical protein
MGRERDRRKEPLYVLSLCPEMETKKQAGKGKRNRFVALMNR